MNDEGVVRSFCRRRHDLEVPIVRHRRDRGVLADGEVLGVTPEAGVVVAEDPVTGGEAVDVPAHRLDDPRELVAEDGALRLRQAGEATDEPRVGGSEAAVRPVDGGGVDPHEQLARPWCRPGDVHHVHDPWGAVPGRDRRLHRRPEDTGPPSPVPAHDENPR